MTSIVIDPTTLHFLQIRYGIVGGSPIMLDLAARLMQVAPTDLSVLITGETGTGKEVYAHALHGLSHRKKYPFVSVNCGAIPETLLESELFGHEKGAFTGAADQRKGFFEVAHNGTIFLDEIGEMPVSTQVKLLRVLESGEFTRLGSSDIHKVNVRIVAATNRDLEYEVRQGNFRHDLFFRLNSVHLRLPPLRRHPEDIPLLIEYYGRRTAEKTGVEFTGISDEGLEMLIHMPWQGNIRELRNFIETVTTLEQGEFITPEIIRRHLRPALPAYEDSASVKAEEAIVIVPPGQHRTHQDIPPGAEDTGILFRTLLELRNDIADIKRALAAIFEKVNDLEHQGNSSHNPEIQETQEEQHSTPPFPQADGDDFRLDEMERKLIIAALKRFDGNRRFAAKVLGISERTLYRKIIDFNLTELV